MAADYINIITIINILIKMQGAIITIVIYTIRHLILAEYFGRH
jgi:hypothetical protein